MKMRKRICAVIMTAALILTLLPAMAFAEEEEAAKPVSAEWSSGYLHGTLGQGTVDFESDLNSIVVKFSDNTEKTFQYDEVELEDDQGVAYTKNLFFDKTVDHTSEAAGFYPELEGTYSWERGLNEAKIWMNVPYVVSGAGTDSETVDYVALTADIEVMCNPEIPTAVEFVPASGFTPDLYLGYNFVTEYDFYGAGNGFRVTYDEYVATDDGGVEQSTAATTFKYAKGTNMSGEEVEGFFMKGDVDLTQFTFEGEDFNFTKAGTYNLGFTYVADVSDLEEAVSVPFKVKVAISKYSAYAISPIRVYNGKVRKPKFTVYNSLGKVIPASAYTVSVGKNKKMGWYPATITFKDKTKYISSIVEYYGIGPKAPKLTKTKAGKKRITVKWKKFTKKQLKKMDGMYIEVATDKYFVQNYKCVKVSKKVLKSGKKVIKGLKKGKRYYVRAYTYNNIKQDGEKMEMPSDNSNRLRSKKVKKK